MTGWEAQFKYTGKGADGEEHTHWVEHAVASWLESDGRVVGLIQDDNKDRRGLSSAESSSNFAGYREIEPVTYLPAETGWWVVQRVQGEENNVAWWERVVAWSIEEGGWNVGAVIQPQSVDAMDEPSHIDEDTAIVYRPGHTNVGNAPWESDPE
jgi:hypothetical protein